MFIHIFRRKEMKSSSLILMGIAVVAVGMFALPSTVSLFSGQHAWYNISYGEKLPCIKCHADIYDEYLMSHVHGSLSGSGNTTPQGGSAANAACYACHRAVYTNRTSITYASGDDAGSTPGEEAHAASTVACMACHEFNASYAAPAAGGFEDPYGNASGLGITNGITADPVTGFTFNYNDSAHPGGHAAHQGFIEGAIKFKRMEDSNEACLGCHTQIPVKINWTHARSLEFNATYDKGLQLPPTHFNTSNYKANGTVEVTSYGNYSGGAQTGSWPSGNVSIWGQ